MPDEEAKRAVTIEVNRDLCTGAAACLVYPFYEIDDESKAVLLTKNNLNSDDPRNTLAKGGVVLIEDMQNAGGLPLEEIQQMAIDSAKICPFNAIIVRDAEGKKIWPPEDDF